MTDQTNTSELQIWVEPKVRELNVRETFGVPNRGTDFSVWPDCTRS